MVTLVVREEVGFLSVNIFIDSILVRTGPVQTEKAFRIHFKLFKRFAYQKENTSEQIE
jgi:hypothetical protein